MRHQNILIATVIVLVIAYFYRNEATTMGKEARQEFISLYDEIIVEKKVVRDFTVQIGDVRKMVTVTLKFEEARGENKLSEELSELRVQGSVSSVIYKNPQIINEPGKLKEETLRAVNRSIFKGVVDDLQILVQ